MEAFIILVAVVAVMLVLVAPFAGVMLLVASRLAPGRLTTRYPNTLSSGLGFLTLFFAAFVLLIGLTVQDIVPVLLVLVLLGLSGAGWLRLRKAERRDDRVRVERANRSDRLAFWLAIAIVFVLPVVPLLATSMNEGFGIAVMVFGLAGGIFVLPVLPVMLWIIYAVMVRKDKIPAKMG